MVVGLVFGQRPTTNDWFQKVFNSSRASVRGGNGNPGQLQKLRMQTK
jgi:hypothetical protein